MERADRMTVKAAKAKQNRVAQKREVSNDDGSGSSDGNVLHVKKKSSSGN